MLLSFVFFWIHYSPSAIPFQALLRLFSLNVNLLIREKIRSRRYFHRLLLMHPAEPVLIAASPWIPGQGRFPLVQIVCLVLRYTFSTFSFALLANTGSDVQKKLFFPEASKLT